MTKETKYGFLKAAAFFFTFFVLLGVAGRCDRQDAMIEHAKTNGRYWQLSADHPDASEGEIMEMYAAECGTEY